MWPTVCEHVTNHSHIYFVSISINMDSPFAVFWGIDFLSMAVMIVIMYNDLFSFRDKSISEVRH